jgi:hypothetical protein
MGYGEGAAPRRTVIVDTYYAVNIGLQFMQDRATRRGLA